MGTTRKKRVSLKLHRFIGVHLGGAKSDRTALVLLDYYPSQKKLFLSEIYPNIEASHGVSSDQVLFDLINENLADLESINLDAPLKFPKCIRCRLKCPGYEACKEKEIVWMWKHFKNKSKKKKRSKIFTPYTQRACEVYISSNVDDSLLPPETLGSNLAPLTARAHFLLRRLPAKLQKNEVFPKLSVLKIGEPLHVAKSHLGFYNHSVGGDVSRQVFLEALVREDRAFIYHQDFTKLISNLDVFDAFVCAYTGFLKFSKQVQKPPRDFPLNDGWVEIPSIS